MYEKTDIVFCTILLRGEGKWKESVLFAKAIKQKVLSILITAENVVYS